MAEDSLGKQSWHQSTWGWIMEDFLEEVIPERFLWDE